MIPESESILPTIQLVVTTAGTVAIAWIGVLQLRAKAKLADASRKLDRTMRMHEDAVDALTAVGNLPEDVQTRLSETRIDKEKS